MKAKKIVILGIEADDVPSQKWKLNKKDLLKVLKGAGIAAGGAAAVAILEALPGLDFGPYTYVLIPVLSILLNTVIKMIQGQN